MTLTGWNVGVLLEKRDSTTRVFLLHFTAHLGTAYVTQRMMNDCLTGKTIADKGMMKYYAE